MIILEVSLVFDEEPEENLKLFFHIFAIKQAKLK